MVGQDHARLIRHVLGASDLVVDTQDGAHQEQRATAPVHVDELVALGERQERRDEEAQRAPQQRTGAQQQVKKKDSDRLQDRHSGMYRCGLARLVKVRLVCRRAICG
ncbi:hypothetical protein D3C75_960850 [compost metagenome]